MNPYDVTRELDDALAEAPVAYRTPRTRPSPAEAKAWCRRLAESHYENFHVATWFLPKRMRPHFQTIYAYCRVSDDLGDEVGAPELSAKLLREWSAMLDECYDAPERSRHPVYVALEETIRECGIPKEPFADLLVAFTRDQTVTRYETLAQLEEYARYSANPVGRLVLYVAGEHSAELHALSDKVCTGLQLANFWQDVAEDAAIGRLYLPAEEMRRFGVRAEDVFAQRCTPGYVALMESLVQRTRALFAAGRPICGKVERELASTLGLFIAGGEAILDAIANQGFNTLVKRPVLGKRKKAQLLARALWNKVQG